MPPQQPSPAAGVPRPPRRAGGRALLVASSVAGVVLLVAGILVAVNVSGGRPYADLPTCRQLVGDLGEEIPGADRPRADGGFEQEDEGGDGRSAELEGALNCDIEETGDGGDREDPYLMSVHVLLYDHEDERGLDDLRRDMEEVMEDRGDLDGEEGYELLEWEVLGAGDIGYVSVQEFPSSYSDDVSTMAFGDFLSRNVQVHYTYDFGDRDDGTEVAEFLSSFGQGLERRLRSEAEFV